METLTAALGRTPATEALFTGAVTSPLLRLEFAAVAPISRAFAPMVREQRYDVSELAIATALQARAYGRPVVALPVALAARFQEAALLCRAEGPVRAPADLAGARIGARAYSQTTCLWLRGILAETAAIDPARQHWTVFEGAHVPDVVDPPWVARAPAGADLLDMLRGGQIDAAIVGNDVPDDPALRTVFADPAAAGAAFQAAHGFMPVNHLACVTQGLAERRPDLVAELLRLFAASRAAARATLPFGRAALRPSVALAIDYALAQGLLPNPMEPDMLWHGLPAEAAP